MGEPTATTITLKRETKEKFDSAKPFETMSADEFLSVLLDQWGDHGD